MIQQLAKEKKETDENLKDGLLGVKFFTELCRNYQSWTS